MPLRLDIKRKLCTRSDRVKCVDFHPSEPWLLSCLYNGYAQIHNYETQQVVKSFEVGETPMRAGKFVSRKNWVIFGSDDMNIRVYNYNTMEKVHQFEAHGDYIRSIAVHPSRPFILTSSDDMTIKLWDWDNRWSLKQTFEGHIHYVMQVVFNPKDNNTFASASLDKTIKVWQLGSVHANFTLDGHERGVNCVDYCLSGEKPFLVSGGDDHLVKIWDYQNKVCVQTLVGHLQNVNCTVFHPELPLILSGSEDGTIKIWHSNMYRLENTLSYGLERCWTACCIKGSNNVAFGFDEGTLVIKLGREEPAASMDRNGKIVWAKHCDIQQANLKAIGDRDILDGERLPLVIKDLGSCEIYPQSLCHSPNGRFIVVCGDGEYIIYTSMALRNKAYGSAQEFVWSSDSSQYAFRDGSVIRIFRNFKETKSFSIDFSAEGLFGGRLLGVRCGNFLTFYDWETTVMIRRIEIVPKLVAWSDAGDLVCIASADDYFILKFDADAVSKALANVSNLTVDGVPDSFEIIGEVQEAISTGIWAGDCFIYTTISNRCSYYVGGEIVMVALLDRPMYILGYIANESRLYLLDKELNVVGYQLFLPVLEYQTAVMRQDFDSANQILPSIPKEYRTRVAQFLDKQGYRAEALEISNDPEHKFELAVALNKLDLAFDIASQLDSEFKWKQVAELASKNGKVQMSAECLKKANDHAGLILIASSLGDRALMKEVGKVARECKEYNVAFLVYFAMAELKECLDILIESKKLSEAALFALTYIPSEADRVARLWKESISKTNERISKSLATPADYKNLFPSIDAMLEMEKTMKKFYSEKYPASAYLKIKELRETALNSEVASPYDDELSEEFQDECDAVHSDNSKSERLREFQDPEFEFDHTECNTNNNVTSNVSETVTQSNVPLSHTYQMREPTDFELDLEKELDKLYFKDNINAQPLFDEDDNWANDV